ncbi:PqqD family protein [Treponema pedis]|uniref:PqqD family protein n=1 Tax=Treponema pedis TaxID=409322 RepID=A0A7S7AW54_9SPIR|nr:PqqD family protein [Treponema pedis]QOW60935.1 PqqD family protein [Treponema pedis]
MKLKKNYRINATSILKRNIMFRVRTLAGINYLFCGDNCFELNEVANSIWEYINGIDNVQTIIEEISLEYGKPVEFITDDILAFLDEMIENQIFIIK